MNYHICMSIETALDMAIGRGRFKSEIDENGIALTETGYFYQIRDILGFPEGTYQSEIVNDLKGMQAEGYTAIPSEGCNNHKGGHCQGHVKRGVSSVRVMQ